MVDEKRIQGTDDGDVSDESESLVGDVSDLPDDVRDGDISDGEDEA